MPDTLENELSVSRNGHSFTFIYWWPRGVDHLADHVLRSLCKGIPFEKAPEASYGRPLGNPFWTIFGRSRYVTLCVTLHVTQQNSDPDRIAGVEKRGIDAKQ